MAGPAGWAAEEACAVKPGASTVESSRASKHNGRESSAAATPATALAAGSPVLPSLPLLGPKREAALPRRLRGRGVDGRGPLGAQEHSEENVVPHEGRRVDGEEAVNEEGGAEEVALEPQERQPRIGAQAVKRDDGGLQQAGEGGGCARHREEGSCRARGDGARDVVGQRQRAELRGLHAAAPPSAGAGANAPLWPTDGRVCSNCCPPDEPGCKHAGEPAKRGVGAESGARRPRCSRGVSGAERATDGLATGEAKDEGVEPRTPAQSVLRHFRTLWTARTRACPVFWMGGLRMSAWGCVVYEGR
jgi:hypothetical protein